MEYNKLSLLRKEPKRVDILEILIFGGRFPFKSTNNIFHEYMNDHNGY